MSKKEDVLASAREKLENPKLDTDKAKVRKFMAEFEFNIPECAAILEMEAHTLIDVLKSGLELTVDQQLTMAYYCKDQSRYQDLLEYAIYHNIPFTFRIPGGEANQYKEYRIDYRFFEAMSDFIFGKDVDLGTVKDVVVQKTEDPYEESKKFPVEFNIQPKKDRPSRLPGDDRDISIEPKDGEKEAFLDIDSV